LTAPHPLARCAGEPGRTSKSGVAVIAVMLTVLSIGSQWIDLLWWMRR
jgi:hypothetical protein